MMPVIGSVDVSAIAAKLNISDLYNHFPRERSMQVKLPKFKLDFTQELEEALTSMGERTMTVVHIQHFLKMKIKQIESNTNDKDQLLDDIILMIISMNNNNMLILLIFRSRGAVLKS